METDITVDPLVQLQMWGVALYRDVLHESVLNTIGQAADRCFHEIESLIAKYGVEQVNQHLPPDGAFHERSSYIKLAALDRHLPGNKPDIWSLVAHSPLREVILQVMGEGVCVNLTQVPVRKQYAPGNAHVLHSPNQWHQDGALGVTFGDLPENNSPYLDTPLTDLLTCWVPLTDCGVDRPGLEFITAPLTQLLHYQFLTPAALGNLFNPDQFWVPQAKVGDALVFLPGTLHRTAVYPAMTGDRLSIELRLFRGDRIPAWMEQDTFVEL